MSRFPNTATERPQDGSVWLPYPEFTVTLAGTVTGDVRVALTDGGHCHVSYPSDTRTPVTFRRKEFMPSVHLYAAHDWQPRPGRDYFTDIHITVKGKYEDATSFARDAIVAAIVTTVRAYLAEHPDIIAEGAVIGANNELKRANDDLAAARIAYDNAIAARAASHLAFLNAVAARAALKAKA